MPFFVLLLGQGSVFAKDLAAHGFRMAGDAARMRMVVEFDREPDLKWFLLRAPHRLVVDFPQTQFGFDSQALKPRGLVTGVRYGNIAHDHSRLIIESDGPFEVEEFAVLENETSPGFRLVADFVASSEKRFEAALAEQSATTGSTRTTNKVDRLVVPVNDGDGKFTLVIDAGHGGIDGGADGVGGTREKDITLTFALELQKALAAQPGLEVFMTRTDDRFLRLDERVRIARRHDADLFISIHADTIRYKSIRGATVYTISEKASDALAEAAADRENLADAVAGIEIDEENKQVADILVDLIRRETHGFSVAFARSLVGEMTDAIELIKNPHRSAGFRVLRAPDVPSVLVELGYLSNSRDEALMKSAEWREKAIGSISSAISLFASAKKRAGG